jgi:hypothetical protein
VAEKELFLRIDAHRTPAVLDLTLAPPREVKQIHVSGGTVEPDNGDRRSSTVHIELAPGCAARFKVNLDIPIGFHSEGRTFVGSKAVEVEQADFSLRLADAHANVFADLDGDGSDDLWRVVGGLGGGIAKPPLRGMVRDVTRRWSHGSYTDVELGLEKDDCRGRQAAALDIDGDGLTDVFESCEGPERHHPAPPFVGLARPGGGYDRQLLPARGEVYRWVPADPGRPPNLLALSRRATLWRSSRGSDWTRVASARLIGGPGQTTLGDFDADAHPDIYVSSPRGSTLLRLRPRSLQAQRPSSLGLPPSSNAAAWVDADGNGLLDLHSLPGGLYAGSGHRFRRTGEIADSAPYAHLSWADFDNNGLREPVIARTEGEFTITAGAWWYGLHPLRRRPRHPWLEVAVPGNWLTARITVTPDRGKRRVGWAGEAETSRYSQGQNRVYFSLPRHARSATVTAKTPDGRTYTLAAQLDRVVSLGP